ncbi:unnamed protein product, partial [Timema podura]|nr:unnamed protein product [Timema podura]
MVANDFLKNKFKTDVRKFSRNYEASLFSEILNAGGTVDSNVIFSPESYLPRSASLNLTVDLFGEAFNVLEFGGRAEGLEQYVEDLFGPDGYYPDKSLRKTLRNIKDRFMSQQEEIENGISALARSFDVKGKLDRAARASLYARVFGNELKYSQFEGLEDVTGGLAGLASPWEVLSRLLSGNTVDYSKSLVFVDASYVIPTSIGLPLEFAVNGSASIALKMGGKIDLEELWTRGSMDVQGHVMPSVAVEFSGLMSVDAFVSKAGVRSVSTLRSNTYLDGKVDILDVTSKLFLVGGAPESQEVVELRGVVEDKERHKACTPQILSTLTGMQLCGELSYRNASRFPDSPYFPLTGPFILSVSADKTDVFDSYELNYRGVRELTKFKDQMTYQLNVDTPGSRVDRKLKLLFSLDNSNKAVKVNVMTPFFRLETDAKLEDDLNGKGFDVSVRLNDDEVLDARGAVRASFNGNMGRYQPSFSLTVMNRKLVDLTGRVDFVTGSKYIGDFNLLGFTKDPVLISGKTTLSRPNRDSNLGPPIIIPPVEHENDALDRAATESYLPSLLNCDLNVDREKWEVSASFKADAINGSVHSSARFNDDSMSVKATAQYGLPGRKEQSVVFSAKTQRSLKGTLAQRSAYLNIQMSAFPQYGVELSLDEQRSSDYLERRAQLALGEVQWQTGFQRRHKITEDHTELSTLVYVTCPKRGVDYKLDLLYQRLPSVLTAHALVNTPSKLWGSLKVTRAPSGQQDIKVELEVPWWTGSAKGRVSRPGLRRIEGTVEAEWTSRGGKTGGLTLKGTLDNLSDARSVVFKGTLEAGGAVDASLVAGLSSRSSDIDLWVIGTRGADTFSGNITCSRNSYYSLTTKVQVGPKTYFSKLVLLNERGEKAIAVDLQLVRRVTLASKVAPYSTVSSG